MNAAELHTALREVVAIGRRGGYDNDEIAENLARVVRAHSRDAVVAVLNEARAVVERETGDYPDASAAVTSGIFGGFDQWAAGRIEELEGIANEIQALQRSCMDHPGPLPRPSCPECNRNAGLVAAARLVRSVVPERRTEATPLDYVRAHAARLGLDPDAMATAAQARIDQAQAWQRSGGPECPDACTCHAYMPPGRVCSWCQQEGHEDS